MIVTLEEFYAAVLEVKTESAYLPNVLLGAIIHKILYLLTHLASFLCILYFDFPLEHLPNSLF